MIFWERKNFNENRLTGVKGRSKFHYKGNNVKEFTWDVENILFVDSGDGYMALCNCKNRHNCT